MISHEECLDKLKHMSTLQDNKATLNSELKKVQEELDGINSEVTEYFELNDLQNIKIERCGTFSIYRIAVPQIEDVEQVRNGGVGQF